MLYTTKKDFEFTRQSKILKSPPCYSCKYFNKIDQLVNNKLCLSKMKNDFSCFEPDEKIPDVYITTNSMINFLLNKENMQNINIKDICNGLSYLCRFSGQINEDYKVAQHCCLLCDIIDEDYKFEALMHDSAETYISDIPTPVKSIIPDIKILENFIYNQISKVFNFPSVISNKVSVFDIRLLVTEAKTFFDKTPDWISDYKFGGIDIEIKEIWSPVRCREEFMKRFKRFNS